MGGSREKNEINRRGQSCPERNTLSAPGSQGKNDSMSGGSQDRHPSGLTTKPHVEQSHCNYNSRRESNTNGGKGSGYGSNFQWGSDCTNGSGIENGWKNFPGAKIQNSPGREAFPGGWSDNQISSTSNGNWSGGDENVTKCSWGVKNIVGREGESATANDAWGGGKSSNTSVKDGKQNINCLNKNSDTSGGRDWVSGQRGSGIDSGGNWGIVSNDNWGRAGGNANDKESCGWGEWGGSRSGGSGTKDVGPRNEDWGDKSHGGWLNIDLGGKEGGRGTIFSGNGSRVSNSWVDGRDGAATSLSSWAAGGNNDVKKSDDWGAWGDRKSGNSGASKGKGNDNWGNKKNTGWDGCAEGSKESGSDTVISGNGCKVSNSWVDGRDGAAAGLSSWAAGGNNDVKKSDDWGAWGDRKSGNSGANKGKGNDSWGNKKNTGWDGCAGGRKESGKDTVTSGNVCTERNSRVDSRDRAATSLRSWASGSNNDGKKSDNWGSWENRKSGNSGVKKGQGNDNWGNKKTNGWEGCDRGSRQSGSDVGTVHNRCGVSNAGWGDCKGGTSTNVGWGASGENVGKKGLGNKNWGNKKTAGWEGCSRQSGSDAGAGNNAVGVSNASWGCKRGTSTNVGWGAGGENVGKKGQGNDNWSNKKTTGWDGCDRGSRQSGSDAGTVNIGGGVSNAGWGDCKGGAATNGGWGAVGENTGKKSGGMGEWGNKNNAGRGGGRAWHSAAEPGSEVKNASWGERSGNRGNKNNTRWDGSDSVSRPSGGGTRTGDNGGGVSSGGWGNSKGGAAASGGWGASGAKDGPKSGGWGEWGKKKSNAETDSKAKNAGWGANSGWK
ncbi:uncharacterized protein LOC112001279 [Quercus suber]|uniref:Uncharacterized protein n=1 Tax=Quercus suber TaxID=58331 RepID=A0AAW0KEQ8_QUESU